MAHRKDLVTTFALFAVVMICITLIILLDTNQSQPMNNSEVHKIQTSILSARGSLPTIENYTPTSSDVTISEGDSQRFNITASVVENVTSNITWYLDGQLVSTSDNYTFVSNYSSAEGGSAGVYVIIVYVVYPEISPNVTLNISRPWSVLVNDVNFISAVALEPTIDPVIITEEDSQRFAVNISSVNLSKVNISMKWYLNDTLVSTSDNYTFTANYSSSNTYRITLNITDEEHYRIREWSMVVTDVPPTIKNYTPTSNFITILEGESQRFNITASVGKNVTSNITWYLDGQLVSTSDNYTFVSNYSSAEGGTAGVYNVTVYLVYVNISANVSRTWSVLVNDVNLTSLVTFTPIANPTITEEENQTFYANLSSIDLSKANISMKWYLNDSIVTTSDNYTFAANYSSSGVHRLVANISDEQHYRIVEWSLTVMDMHRTTSVYPTINPTINEGENYTFSITTNSTSIYSPNVTWCVDGTKQSFLNYYTFTSNSTSAGVYNITVNVVDRESNFTYIWSLTVVDINYLQLQEGESHRFNITTSIIENATFNTTWYMEGQLISTSDNYTFVSNYTSAEMGEGAAGIYNITMHLLYTNTSINISRTWYVQVNDVNLTSVATFTPSTNPTITEEENQTFYANLSSIDLSKTNISMKWYLNDSIVSTSDNYTFVANYSSSGVYNVMVNISDQEHCRTVEWPLTVVDVHRTTLAYPTMNPMINEGTNCTFSIITNSTSIYSPNITWYVGGEKQSSLNYYTFTSNYSSAGVYNITVNVVDRESNFTNIWNLTVLDVNYLQLINITPLVRNLTIEENQTSMFIPDTAWLSWTQPSFKWYLNDLLVSNTSTYTFATDYSSAGTHTLKLNVSDSNYSTDFIWDITVNNVPRPPVIEFAEPSITDCSLLEGNSQTFNATVTDPTGYSPDIFWYLDGSLVSTETSFVFNTDYSSAGVYNITLNIIGREGNITKKWHMEVKDLNRLPEVTKYPATYDITINEMETVNFTISASDLDIGDIITINWFLDGILIHGTYETYSYTPNYTSAGIHSVVANISDVPSAGGIGKSDTTCKWNITVMNVNRKPAIVNYMPTYNPTIKECENQTFGISAVDPDGDQTTTDWYLDGILIMINSTTYKFDTNYSSAKVYALTSKTTDGDLETSHTWSITVQNKNRPPKIDKAEPRDPNINISEGSSVVFTAESSDPDGTPTSVKWYLDGVFVGWGARYVYDAGFNSYGAHTFTLSVTDVDNASEKNIWWMNITDVNRVPVIYKTMPQNASVTIRDRQTNFSIEAKDSDDDDVLLFYWYLNGSRIFEDVVDNYTFLAVSNHTLGFNHSSSGAYNLTVIVSDNKSSDSHSWTLYVNISNKKPIATIVSIKPNATVYKQNIEFVGNGTDEDGTIIEYNWRSSVDGFLNNTKNFNISTLSLGQHTIYFKVKDNDGEWSDEANATINVSQETTFPVAPAQKINEVIIGVTIGAVVTVLLILLYVSQYRSALTKKRQKVKKKLVKKKKKIVKKRKQPKIRLCTHCKKEIPRELVEAGWAECPHCGKEWEASR